MVHYLVCNQPFKLDRNWKLFMYLRGIATCFLGS